MNAIKTHFDEVKGATLIEFLVILSLIGLVAAGVHLFGWLLGVVFGGVVFLAAGFLVAVLRDGFTGIPPLPRCRNGCCAGPGLLSGHGDYRSERFGEDYIQICRCGIRHKRSDRRFMTVAEDGTKTPYLVWKPYRGWFPDETNEGQQCDTRNHRTPSAPVVRGR